VRLVGPDASRLVEESERLLHDRAVYEAMVPGRNPFGDGKASERIVGVISRFLDA
jgi:UDP-N-acetylglucosamine 2-epimerase